MDAPASSSHSQLGPTATMAAAALFFALTLPIEAYAQAHHHPLHYAAVIRIINGAAHLAFAFVLGRSHSIP